MTQRHIGAGGARCNAGTLAHYGGVVHTVIGRRITHHRRSGSRGRGSIATRQGVSARRHRLHCRDRVVRDERAQLAVGNVGHRRADLVHFGIGRKQLAAVNGIRAACRHTACRHIGDGALGTCGPHTHRADGCLACIGVGIAVDGVARGGHSNGCDAAISQRHRICITRFCTIAHGYRIGSAGVGAITDCHRARSAGCGRIANRHRIKRTGTGATTYCHRIILTRRSVIAHSHCISSTGTCKGTNSQAVDTNGTAIRQGRIGVEVLDARAVVDVSDRGTDLAHFGIGRKQLAAVDGIRAANRHPACGHIGDGALGTCGPHTHRAAGRATRIGVRIAVDGVACRAHGSGCGAA